MGFGGSIKLQQELEIGFYGSMKLQQEAKFSATFGRELLSGKPLLHAHVGRTKFCSMDWLNAQGGFL